MVVVGFLGFLALVSYNLKTPTPQSLNPLARLQSPRRDLNSPLGLNDAVYPKSPILLN